MKKTLSKSLPILFLSLFLFSILSACGSQSDSQASAPEGYQPTPIGTHHVEIEVANYGVISAELNGDAAPVSVANFMKLAKEGFYNGLTFHRIMDGFMIQGGDPNRNGSGGSDETIVGEFSANGIANPLSHTRGAISMARSKSYDSASSQFFIVHQDSTSLDGEYAVFGYVTKGMDIVDAICANTPVEDNNGTVAAENQPVITAVRVVD